MRKGPRAQAGTKASLVVTFASIAAAALGNVAAYKVVALVGDPVLLSHYSEARRYLTFLIPLLALGGGVAIPLRVAIRPVMDEGLRILYLQLKAAAVVTLAILAIVALMPAKTLTTGVPDLRLVGLVAVVITAYASNCTAMLYALHRGMMRFRSGAWILVLANGVFPALAALAVVQSVELTLLLWAGMNGALTVGVLCKMPRPPRGPIPHFGSLLRSALGRVPGDLAYAALFMLPVTLYAASGAPTREAVFNYFFVILGVLTAAASPIAIVMLPVIGARVAAHGRTAARGVVFANLGAACLAGVGVFVAMRWLASPLLTLLLSSRYAREADLLSALAPAALGLALFVFLRTTVDGVGEQPLVAGLCLLSLLVFLGVRLGTQGWTLESSLVLATNLSLGTLGLSTMALSLFMFSRPSPLAQQ